MKTKVNQLLIIAITGLLLSACDNDNAQDSRLDSEVRKLAATYQMSGDPTVDRNAVDISSPQAQLGKKLFFSKSLSAEFESGCVTCHHPTLGFGDGLSLAIGTEAIDPDVLGPGRVHESGLPPHPRNALTTINVGVWDQALFWDGRLESMGKTPTRHGNDGNGIRTPETVHENPDANAAKDLSSSFGAFPVTEPDEMAGFEFKTEIPKGPERNAAIREHLAARLGDYGVGAGELDENEWLSEFQAAFNTTADAENLITFENIRDALGAYMQSQVFINSPWRKFLDGDDAAMSTAAKRGAQLFFTPREEGGFDCRSCHQGDFFTNESFYVLAVPQIGPGKGDGLNGTDDIGRARETLDPTQNYKFRVPTLLNVEMTGPYTHVGSYQTLEDMVRHHLNPALAIDEYFANDRWCELQQYSPVENCTELFPEAEANTRAALQQLEENRANDVPRVLRDVTFTERDVEDVAAFLRALTDPCLKDRDCLLPWIADTDSNGPDGQQLNATDADGNLL